MEYLNNFFGLLLVLGLVAVAVAVLWYFRQKGKLQVMETSVKTEALTTVGDTVDKLVRWDADSLMAYLSPLRNDQPLFTQAVVGLLQQTKTKMDIAMIKVVAERLDAQGDLLRKINEYLEQQHELERKSVDFAQRDNLQDLKYEEEELRLTGNIELIKNPPPPPPAPPPPKSRAEREAEDQERKEKEKDKQDKKEREWIVELTNDPNVAKEDIPTIIERRKRERGWLDNI